MSYFPFTVNVLFWGRGDDEDDDDDGDDDDGDDGDGDDDDGSFSSSSSGYTYLPCKGTQHCILVVVTSSLLQSCCLKVGKPS